MRLILIAAIVTQLTACATAPQWLASYYDSQDPCQLQNNGGKYPRYCGAGSSGRATVYATPNQNPIGKAVGYVK